MKSSESRWLQKMAAFLLAVIVMIPSAAAFAAEAGKTVRVGWVEYPGMAEVHDGKYSGYNYDYLMEIAKYTGWEYEFVSGDVQTCSKMLAEGEIDLLGLLLYTPERTEFFDYAMMENGRNYSLLFTTLSSSVQPHDFDAFNGMKVGVLSGGDHELFQEYENDNGFSCDIVDFAGVNELTVALFSGEIDAAVTEGFVNDSRIRVIAEIAAEPYYFATTKGNKEILVGLNRALSSISIDRPYIERELYDKYFGIEFNPELNDAELALVEASKKEPVTLGVIPSSAPACFWDDEKGELAGIFMDILKALSEKTGLRFEYVALDPEKGSPVAQLKRGSPELVAGVLKTQSFAEDSELVLSDKLTDDSLVFVGRRGDDFTQDPEEKIIAVCQGFQVGLEYAAERFPQQKVVECQNVKDGLELVKSGKADAALYMQTSVSYYMQDPHYESLEIIAAFTRNMNTCVVGLAEDDQLLMSVINKGLAMLSDNERSSILMDYTIMNSYHMNLGDMLYKYRVPFCIISLLVLMVISALIALSVVKNRSEKKLHKAYEQEKQALAVAERASAAKGGFMSRMSHEIRTPLNAVIGYNNIARSELALAHDENGRRQAEMKVLDCLTKSEMASKHLLTIINDVLDMSAIESGKIQVAHERFDFKNMILSLTALFYSQSKAKDVEFEVVFDTLTEEWFVGDQMRVNQILTNLLSNAVKFTPPGGSVRLIIRQPEAETNAAHIHFEIKDSGIGMSAEYMKDLWAPFEQADSSISRRFGGTGLGLSITKSLVDLMGGSINAESQPGEGTTFSVDLTFERAEQSKDTGAYDFSKINALVVDDDASTCDYIQMLFTRCGVRCTAVTSGKDAVELFSKNLGTENGFTACLVDWRMPQMDGIKTVKCIKSLAQDDVAIVVVTAYDFSEIADAAKEAGADMFVSKPLFQSSLFDLLANISGAAPEKLERDKEFDFAGVRVLLAEDNEMNMEVACHMLASVGLEVDCAENGRAAADMFCNAPAGTYGAILMDIHMPEMDGHQASRAIRSSGHEEAMTIPIIAMTADAFAENVAEAKASGMNDHIAKPIDSEKLFKTLSKYI